MVPDLLAHCSALLAGEALTPWQRAFVVGCERHVNAGRSLSDKQIIVLQRLLNISSDCPVSVLKCPEIAGQMTGTGHARAHTEPGHCPVPVPSRFAPEVSR